MPYPLHLPPTARLPERRPELADEIHRELTDRGLMSANVLDGGLESLLRLLGGHRVSVNAVAHVGYPVWALAAADETASPPTPWRAGSTPRTAVT